MNRENVKIFGKNCIILCCILLVISIGVSIILVSTSNLNDVLPIIIAMMLLSVVSLFGIYYGYVRVKNPDKYIVRSSSNQISENKILYKNKGYTYDIACELYCNQKNKTVEELTDDDERIIWDYSWDDFTYLLMWIIENGYYQFCVEQYGENMRDKWMSFINDIKLRKVSPVEFFESTDGNLFIGEVSNSILGFVQEYLDGSLYNNGHYYLKEENKIGGFEVDLEKFVSSELNSQIYGFGFKWDDYDRFKVYIDNAYARYKQI